MRKAILVLFMFVPLLALCKDDEASFAVEGMTWKGYHDCSKPFDTEPDLHYFKYQVRGDTVVGGKKCKKIYNYSSLAYIIYEEGGKVFEWHKAYNCFYTIFDFSLCRRDTISCDSWTKTLREVVSVDTIAVKGRKYKRIKVKENWGYVNGVGGYYWIEGIGGTDGLFNPGSNDGAAGYHLQSCELNGEVLFDDTDIQVANFQRECMFGDYEEVYPGMTWQLRSVSGDENAQSSVRNDEYKLGEYDFVEVRIEDWFERGSLPFMRVYHRSSINGENMPKEWTATDDYILPMEGRFFLYNSVTERLPVIMDFSLMPGEVFHAYDAVSDMYTDYRVIAVSDTILGGSDTMSRKCIYLQSVKDPQTTDIWIEGVGSLKYGIAVHNPDKVDSHSCLMTCSNKDSILYKLSEGTVSVTHRTVDTALAGSIYDLQGRRLTTEPCKGVYIRDGRKVMVK